MPNHLTNRCSQPLFGVARRCRSRLVYFQLEHSLAPRAVAELRLVRWKRLPGRLRSHDWIDIVASFAERARLFDPPMSSQLLARLDQSAATSASSRAATRTRAIARW